MAAAGDAAVFDLEYDDGEGVKVCLLGSTSTYIYAEGSGSVSLAKQLGTTFTMLLTPLLGTTTARWALKNSNGAKISLWGGPRLGWVTAHPKKLMGGGAVTSRTTKLNKWEQLTLSVRDAATGNVSLRSDHGLWLSAEPSGKLSADRKATDAWETFSLVQADATFVALKTCHGSYVSADNQAMDCKATSITNGQRFFLFDAEAARALYFDTNPTFNTEGDPFAGRLSALHIAGIVAVAVGGTALLAGGIAATVLAVDAAKKRREDARAAADKQLADAVAAQDAATAASDRAKAEAAAAEAAAARATAEVDALKRELEEGKAARTEATEARLRELLMTQQHELAMVAAKGAVAAAAAAAKAEAESASQYADIFHAERIKELEIEAKKDSEAVRHTNYSKECNMWHDHEKKMQEVRRGLSSRFAVLHVVSLTHLLAHSLVDESLLPSSFPLRRIPSTT